jgi:hypothetical protein
MNALFGFQTGEAGRLNPALRTAFAFKYHGEVLGSVANASGTDVHR